MPRWIIDRIENGIAVLESVEGANTIYHPVTDLPNSAREGMALINDGQVFLPDESEEAYTRSRRIKEKFERLKKSNKRENS